MAKKGKGESVFWLTFDLLASVGSMIAAGNPHGRFFFWLVWIVVGGLFFLSAAGNVRRLDEIARERRRGMNS